VGLADVTRDSVRQALDEFDRLGRDPFLAKYGFGKSRDFFIVEDDRRYDSKPILGAAHGFARPDLGPLSAKDFSGDENGAALRLRELHFTVEKSSAAVPHVWWVNQGATYKYEREGGYLWAPLKTKAGHSVAHHANVGKLQRGDVVLNYANSEIRSISRVTGEPENRSRPAELPSEPWGSEGHYAPLEYFDLAHPIDRKEISDRSADVGPFDQDGGIKQVYLVPLADDFAAGLRSEFSSRWPDG
jgi:hypothetical protein